MGYMGREMSTAPGKAKTGCGGVLGGPTARPSQPNNARGMSAGYMLHCCFPESAVIGPGLPVLFVGECLSVWDSSGIRLPIQVPVRWLAAELDRGDWGDEADLGQIVDTGSDQGRCAGAIRPAKDQDWAAVQLQGQGIERLCKVLAARACDGCRAIGLGLEPAAIQGDVAVAQGGG